ncbi:PREDICTED: 28S ribosomal protein S23, mitochondrial-like isoform X2 [Priapulus caudatus]|nr:PREDICTED: 28S ribosomal protein S23, mitochondrial-like isoform X2 [Priapulus caudatus]
MRAGVLSEEDKPLWFDVYKTFPPKYEPYADRPPADKEIVDILYPEDIIRAKFYKKFGSPGTIDMTNHKTKALSERFIKKHQELEHEGVIKPEQLFTATTEALANEGLVLERTHSEAPERPVRGGGDMSETRDGSGHFTTQVKVSEMFKDAQLQRDDSKSDS